jgi:hypothetical protein
MHSRKVFDNANAFNGDVGRWDVSGVTIMESGKQSGVYVKICPGLDTLLPRFACGLVFFSAGAFDQDLHGWDVSSTTNMENSKCN